VKKLVTDIAGIVTVASDMCIYSCHAYTGPWAKRETCYDCGEPRYDQVQLQATGKKVPLLQFESILLGPQLQARCRHADTAAALRYRSEKCKEVEEMAESLRAKGDFHGRSFVYDDIMCGQQFRELRSRLDLTEDDVVSRWELLIGLD
jgi:hypothetical protein